MSNIVQQDILQQLKQLQKDAETALAHAKSAEATRDWYSEYLSRKGRLTGILRNLGSLSAAERPLVGKVANEVKAVLENAFMFLADLVRSVEVPVVCQFIKPKYTRPPSGASHEVMEIFFSHEPDIRGQHILLVEGLVHSGVTSEFLMSDLRGRGAASVKLVTLLDRQAARRVSLQPDYFGFLVDDTFLVGYGLGAVERLRLG